MKQEYHRIKAGVYCSEWEIDAVLCYYAQRMEENKIRFHFFFGNYRKNSVKYEVLNQILIILLEEAIERNLSEKEGKRQISLTGGTVRNQLLLVLKTVRRGKFRIRKLRMYIEKDGGNGESGEKRNGNLHKDADPQHRRKKRRPVIEKSENTIDFFLYNLISLCYTQNVEYSRGSGIGISNRFLITGDY